LRDEVDPQIKVKGPKCLFCLLNSNLWLEIPGKISALKLCPSIWKPALFCLDTCIFQELAYYFSFPYSNRNDIQNNYSSIQDILCCKLYLKLKCNFIIWNWSLILGFLFQVSVGQSEAKVCKWLNKFISPLMLSTISVYTCHKFERLMCHL
jgi:hypothetical protein